jgi:hypothetical protein
MYGAKSALVYGFGSATVGGSSGFYVPVYANVSNKAFAIANINNSPTLNTTDTAFSNGFDHIQLNFKYRAF